MYLCFCHVRIAFPKLRYASHVNGISMVVEEVAVFVLLCISEVVEKLTSQPVLKLVILKLTHLSDTGVSTNSKRSK